MSKERRLELAWSNVSERIWALDPRHASALVHTEMGWRPVEQPKLSMSSATKNEEPEESLFPGAYCVELDADENVVELMDLEVALKRDGGGEEPRRMLAVIPLMGVLTPYGYGGTSTTQFARAIRAADRSQQIHSILIHIDSPGGMVTGTPEAADAVYEVRRRGRTRVEAVVDGLMASAATWIGTAAHRVSVNRSGDTGSIGVIALYADMSRMLSEAGVDVSVIRTPAKKARFSGVEPLTEQMREDLEGDLQEIYSQFRREMARNRGVSVAEVEERFGGGETLMAKQALAAGLVDGIETVDQAIARLAVPPNRAASGERRAAREESCERRVASGEESLTRWRAAEIELAKAEVESVD